MSQRTKCLAPIQGRNQIQKYESVFHKMFSKEQVTKENLSKQKASKATRIEHLAHIQSSKFVLRSEERRVGKECSS